MNNGAQFPIGDEPYYRPLADDWVARIFGRNRYTGVDRVQQLPERLPALFLNLTG